jgi:hypothetical protein
MDILLGFFVVAVVLSVLKGREQRGRILWLAGELQNYQLERLMETLADGYLRALGEGDAARRQSVWGVLEGSETALADQLGAFANDMKRAEGVDTGVVRVPWLPGVQRWWPRATFDFRRAVAIHAEGYNTVAANGDGLSRNDQAFRLMAEMLLFQHTCHWFCRGKAMADARLVARHQTAYQQVLDAVSPATRRAYEGLVKG